MSDEWNPPYQLGKFKDQMDKADKFWESAPALQEPTPSVRRPSAKQMKRFEEWGELVDQERERLLKESYDERTR